MRGSDAPSQQLLPPQEQLTVVADPPLAKKMGDEIPVWDDPADIDIPKASSPPVQHKPVEAQKALTNQKGIQKIAGARR